MPNNRVKTIKSMQGKNAKEEKLAKHKKARTQTMSSKVDRLLWFCFALDPEVTHYTQHGDLHQIAQDYCSRHDAAIQEEIDARRPGRPKSKKQETLEFQRTREQGEYDGAGGFMMPNLMDRTSVLNLRHWSDKTEGDPSFLPRLNLIRIYSDKPEVIVVEQQGAGSHLSFEDSEKAEAMDVEESLGAESTAA